MLAAMGVKASGLHRKTEKILLLQMVYALCQPEELTIAENKGKVKRRLCMM